MEYGSIVAIIPARIKSQRLPNKVLADIHGKPMVIRVAHIAKDAGFKNVYIATDSQQVVDICNQYNFDSIITPEVNTGTDRVASAVELLGFPDQQLIINIQADEPLLQSEILVRVSDTIIKSIAEGILCVTPIGRIQSTKEVFDPNIVKCVINNNGLAHYFSRAPIPWYRDIYPKLDNNIDNNFLGSNVYRHFGIYAFTTGFVKAFSALNPSYNEQAEKLEQLRILDNGYQIQTVLVEAKSMPAVDTAKDLELVRKIYQEQYL